jgi:hypothetical protein
MCSGEWIRTRGKELWVIVRHNSGCWFEVLKLIAFGNEGKGEIVIVLT